jgi:hypothetical protein
MCYWRNQPSKSHSKPASLVVTQVMDVVWAHAEVTIAHLSRRDWLSVHCTEVHLFYFSQYRSLNSGPTLRRQAFYHLSHCTSPFLVGYFRDRVLWTIYPSWLQTMILRWAPGAHTFNLSYSGGRDQEDPGSKAAQANSSWDPSSKKSITKKGWWSGSRYRLLVQTSVPHTHTHTHTHTKPWSS